MYVHASVVVCQDLYMCVCAYIYIYIYTKNTQVCIYLLVCVYTAYMYILENMYNHGKHDI